MWSSFPAHSALAEQFAQLPDEDERLYSLIQFGRAMPPLDESERIEANLVRGCSSSVWLICEAVEGSERRLRFRGGSDAQIVAGLVALVLAKYSGLTPEAILSIDPATILTGFGLESAISPGRRNGLSSMIARIRQFAAEAVGWV